MTPTAIKAGAMLTAPTRLNWLRAWVRTRPRVPAQAFMGDDGVSLTVQGADRSVAIDLEQASTAQRQVQAVQALLGLASEAGHEASAIAVTVCDSWLRPVCLDMSEHLSSDAERSNLVDAHYRSVFGSSMDEWATRWHVQGDGRIVALALPPALGQLGVQFASIGVHLESLTAQSPGLLSRVPQGRLSAWIAHWNRSSLTAIRGAGPHWLAWQVCALEESSAEALCTVLYRVVEALEQSPSRRLRILRPRGASVGAAEVAAGLIGQGWTVTVHDLP